MYSVVFINGLFHVMPFALGLGYNPGLLTAVVLFLPLSAWVGYACFGKARLSYKVMALLIFSGILLHVILVGSTFMFLHGVIGGATLVLVQIINPGLLLLIAWFAEKWRGGVLTRPVNA